MFQLFSLQGRNDVPTSLELHNETSDQATDIEECENFDVTITNNPTCSQHKMKKERLSGEAATVIRNSFPVWRSKAPST